MLLAHLPRFFRTAFAMALFGFCLGIFALQAQAQDHSQPAVADQKAILDTIRGQLNAFQVDDDALAFSYATPQLREMFGNSDNFMAMVRGGYMSVYRPQSVEFLDSRVVAGRTGQAVRFVGPDGTAVIAIYTMEQQPDGSWRIAAVQLIPTGEISS